MHYKYEKFHYHAVSVRPLCLQDSFLSGFIIVTLLQTDVLSMRVLSDHCACIKSPVTYGYLSALCQGAVHGTLPVFEAPSEVHQIKFPTIGAVSSVQTAYYLAG